MNAEIKNLYAQILELNREVTVVDRGGQIDINESDDGWNIVCYNLETVKDSDNYMLVEHDGGLCTGSALDAVEFMLPIETPLDKPESKPKMKM